MTCTVALLGAFAGPMIGADTRVCWPDRTFADGVQKVFPVGPNVLMGFAGSVRLGFDAARVAREAWRDDGGPTPVPHPRRVAAPLAERLAAVWPSWPEDARKRGLTLLVVGSQPWPTPPQIDGSIVLPRSVRGYGYLLRAPRFELELLQKGVKIIGSAAGEDRPFVAGYEWAADWPEFEFSGMPPDMLIRIGLDKAFEQLDPAKVVDVGQQMQTWLIGEADARFMGSETLLAQSWEEVEQIARKARKQAAAASAWERHAHLVLVHG